MDKMTIIIIASISGFVIVTFLFLLFQYLKTLKIMENDLKYEKRDATGVVQKGRTRNRWDLSYFPGLSRSLFKSDWRIILAIMLLIFISIMYAIFRNDQLLNLILVSTGAVIGVLTKQDSISGSNEPE